MWNFFFIFQTLSWISDLGRTLPVAISVDFWYILLTKVQFLIVFFLYFRPSHQSLKSRDRGQGAPEDLAGRDFRRELEERERKVIDETYFILKKWYFVTKVVLTYCEKKIVLVIEKNFWNSRLKATCSWRFLISDKLEQLELKLEKNIGIYKHVGKVTKLFF